MFGDAVRQRCIASERFSIIDILLTVNNLISPIICGSALIKTGVNRLIHVCPVYDAGQGTTHLLLPDLAGAILIRKTQQSVGKFSEKQIQITPRYLPIQQYLSL